MRTRIRTVYVAVGTTLDAKDIPEKSGVGSVAVRRQLESSNGRMQAAKLEMRRGARLTLLGGFDLVVDDVSVPLTGSAQRLVALLALRRPSVTRTYAAGMLWPDRPDERAAANLRSALWRLPTEGRAVVESTDDRLALSPGVACDFDELLALARRAIVGDWPRVGDPVDPAVFCRTLLPGWYLDWVVADGERLRERCAQGLEALCRSLSAVRRHAEAVEAGMAVVAFDQLRESAQRALVEAHLAQGNRAAAASQYRRFETHMASELRLAPSPDLRRLLEG